MKTKNLILILLFICVNLVAQSYDKKTISMYKKDKSSLGLKTNNSLTPKEIEKLISKKMNNYLEVNDFEYDRSLRANHKFLGYTTLAMIATEIYLGLEEKQMTNFYSVHQALGEYLAMTMLINSATGAYAHREDIFDTSEGFTKKHIHAILGSLATYYIAANAISPDDSSHKDDAIIGGSLALIGYSITLF